MDTGGHSVKDWKRIAVFALIVAGVVVFDHISKLLAADFLSDGLRRSYLADTIRLEAVSNPGAILGLGSQLPEGIRSWVMPFVTVVVLIWVSVLLIRDREFGFATIGLSLVWAGGFSNLVDRIAYGKVFDFMNIGVGAVRTGIFNLADMAIMAGIPVILIGWLRAKQVKEDVVGI
jgi:signal peptidase II